MSLSLKPTIHWLWIAVALAGLAYFANVGGMAFTDRDEGNYAVIVNTMHKTGDYVVPKINGEVHLSKPVLLYWASLACVKVFGNNEFAMRLPAVLSGILLLTALAWTLRRVSDDEFSFLSLASLAFTPMYFIMARVLLVDMLLTLCTTLALLWYFLATEAEDTWARRGWYVLTWFAIAFGFLCKGPVALAAIGPTAALYALLQRRFWKTFSQSMIPVGVVILLLVNFWYFLAYQRLGWELVGKFFGGEILERGTKGIGGHTGSVFYYLPIILIGVFPFSFPAAAGWWLGIRQSLARRQENSLNRLLFFSALAAGLILLVFSLAATKLPHYIFPAVPFLGILAAGALRRLIRADSPPKWLRRLIAWPVSATYVALALAALAVPFITGMVWSQILKLVRPDSTEFAFPSSPPEFLILPIILAVISLAAAVATFVLCRKGKFRELAAVLTLTSVLYCGLGLVIGGQTLDILQEPSKQLALKLKSHLSDRDGEIIVFGLYKPSLLYYLDRGFQRLRATYPDHQADLHEIVKRSTPIYVLTRTSLKNQLSEYKDLCELEKRQGYLLAGNALAQESWRGKNQRN